MTTPARSVNYVNPVQGAARRKKTVEFTANGKLIDPAGYLRPFQADPYDYDPAVVTPDRSISEVSTTVMPDKHQVRRQFAEERKRNLEGGLTRRTVGLNVKNPEHRSDLRRLFRLHESEKRRGSN
jgi:hypothetical protein